MCLPVTWCATTLSWSCRQVKDETKSVTCQIGNPLLHLLALKINVQPLSMHSTSNHMRLEFGVHRENFFQHLFKDYKLYKVLAVEYRSFTHTVVS